VIFAYLPDQPGAGRTAAAAKEREFYRFRDGGSTPCRRGIPASFKGLRPCPAAGPRRRLRSPPGG